MIPDYIDPECWDGYKAMRKAIKKPMTARAEKMALRILDNLMKQGEDPNLVLEQSEFHNWQSLYPVKSDFYQLMGYAEPIQVEQNKQSAVILRMNSRDWAK